MAYEDLPDDQKHLPGESSWGKSDEPGDDDSEDVPEVTEDIDDADAALINKLESDPYFNGDETQRLFQKAILLLPEKQRIIFNLKYFQEMKYEDMSEILGTSVGALKASYHHAVKKIEDFFHQHD